ncbi:MAG: HD domain-containing protein [Clostridiales bacterium]|nr:HD domain-containing protein [Clostridiales bacterium]
MKYIETFREGEKVTGVYFCKQKTSAVTKNGKPYESVILQDKTGTIDSKIWDPNSLGIDDFDALDYVDIVGDITVFNGITQLSIKRARKAEEGEYDEKEYLPASDKDVESMYSEIIGFINSVENTYLKTLLEMFFVEDENFIQLFKKHSAAKSVHHGFIGGLLEHTLSVTKLCDAYTKLYPILNRDLLITAAMFHDIGKTEELSTFPINDYTDEGQLLGHIVIGYQRVTEAIGKIPDFPVKMGNELKHCILSHHGELEYGSPKKPALIEAIALNFADNTDAKIETMKELLTSAQPAEGTQWLGYNRFLETNIRRTSK